MPIDNNGVYTQPDSVGLVIVPDALDAAIEKVLDDYAATDSEFGEKDRRQMRAMMISLYAEYGYLPTVRIERKP